MLGANAFLFFSYENDATITNKTFLNANELEGLNRITFIYGQDEVAMVKGNDGWILNEKYPVDEGFLNTLRSILQRIEVVREIGVWEESELGSVILGFDSNPDEQFQFASNPTKTKSYFINGGIAKEVIVPGYRDNVVDIFMLHPDQWRNRMVFDGSWRSIQRLRIKQ